MAENLDTKRSLPQSGIPTIISRKKNWEIVGMNEAAIDFFGGCSCQTALELFDFSIDDINWYNSVDGGKYRFGFRVVDGLNGHEKKFIVDSTYTEHNGETVRIDTVSPINSFDFGDYYSKYELFTEHLKFQNRAEASDEQINDILDYAVFVYAADRAFVLEIDKNIGCLSDIYSRSREGFQDTIASVRSIGEVNVERLVEIWDRGNDTYNKAFEKNDQTSELYSQLYNSLDRWPTMMVPFSKQSGIRCFLCVDNVRRFLGQTSILDYMTTLIANMMYATQLKDSAVAAKNLSTFLSHIPENLVKIYMFGGLKIQTGLGIREDSSFSSAQCATFFVYLLSNRNRTVPVREIADILWPGRLVDNPYDMIKGVAFRTRKMFENICRSQIIIAGNGTYSINRDLDIWLDIEEFDRLCRQAKNTKLSDDVRCRACEQAVDLYRGGMLPNFEAETWLTARIYYYQLQFEDLLGVYMQILRTKSDYITMLNVTAKATEIGDVDISLHLMVIETMLSANRKTMARGYFSSYRSQLSEKEQAEILKALDL